VQGVAAALGNINNEFANPLGFLSLRALKRGTLRVKFFSMSALAGLRAEQHYLALNVSRQSQKILMPLPEEYILGIKSFIPTNSRLAL
jgi:hypothetical protein